MAHVAAMREHDASARDLNRLADHLEEGALEGRPVRVTVSGSDRSDFVAELPKEAVRLLREVITEIARGNAVTVVPVEVALTTQQAAGLLGVSRPHLISMLEAGRLPFHMVGKHRRIRFDDLMTFRNKLAELRKKTLDELAAHDQALGIL